MNGEKIETRYELKICPFCEAKAARLNIGIRAQSQIKNIEFEGIKIYAVFGNQRNLE